MKPLIVTIPHTGEELVEESTWLRNLPENILMYDVDRFADRLYKPALDQYQIPRVTTPYHRYVVDCNRWISDVDADSVEGSHHPSGEYPTGLHWRQTTGGYILLKKPLTQQTHQKLVKKYYNCFFEDVDALFKQLKSKKAEKIYHLDIHSMPSKGTQVHRDPGKLRSDIVIGDIYGKTSSPQWTEQVKSAYQAQGFTVSLNTPYIGGTIIEKYGHLQQGHQSLMIEINRNLYMDENTKQWIPEKAEPVQQKLISIISNIYKNLPDIDTH